MAGRRPAIGHDCRLEAEHIAHHHGAQMAVGSDTAMREVGLVALRLDPGHVILRSRAGDRLAADQHHRRVVDEADRLERGFGIVAQIVEQAGRRQQRDVIDQDRGTVRCRSGNAIIGQRAAAADHVLDDDGLAERAPTSARRSAARRYRCRRRPHRAPPASRSWEPDCAWAGVDKRSQHKARAQKCASGNPIDHGSILPGLLLYVAPHFCGRVV